jgi:tripartite motif-containing protein 71
MRRKLRSFARKATSSCLGAPLDQPQERRLLPRSIAIPAAFVLLLVLAPSASASVQFDRQWGGYGSHDGQFSSPTGVATDSSGNIYVADQSNARIQKFDSAGAFITKWGSSGSGDGQFSSPTGVATDSSGNVYVSEVSADRIQKFDSSGTFLAKWGSQGSGDGEFMKPQSVATDSSGNVYVADTVNNRMQ